MEVPTDVAAIGMDGKYPIVTLTGFCTMILTRMANAAGNDTGEFPELSLGLIRILSGWIVERGVEHQLIHDAVDLGVTDYRESVCEGHGTDIPIEEGH